MKTAIVWLRNDLRFQDQESFFKACNDFDRVVAYYTFEPKEFLNTQWGIQKSGVFRIHFILETLAALKTELLQKNITLIVENKAANEGIPYWVDTINASTIFYQKEWTSEEKFVTDSLIASLPTKVILDSHYDQFLFHPDDLPMAIDSIPEVFTFFRKQSEKLTQVRPCISSPKLLSKDSLLNKNYPLLSLKSLGFNFFETPINTAFPFSGGTKSAIHRLDDYFWKSKRLSFYKKTRNGMLGSNYSSKFSPWLANGSLSAKTIYWSVKKYEKEVHKNESTYWLIFELIWRDYFKYISLKHGTKIFKLGGILTQKYTWETNHEIYKKWIEGKTSEPFINANMIELKKTGFMSNRGRQNVASYFTKNMLMDWRMGAAYFEQQLIDYDVHSNWGNWMYVAGVGNDPRDRKFNIQFQASRYDAKGTYQKKWLQNTLFK